MGGLTRDEQRVCRRIGGWKIATLLVNPDLWSTDLFGASHFDALGNEHAWVEGSASKVVVLDMLGGEPVLTLKWSKVKQHAKTLPKGLRDRLAANQREHNRLNAATMLECPWSLRDAFRGIGPITEKQHRRHAAQDELRARTPALKTEQNRLLDEAFPLAIENAEPTDLLELLAAIA